MLLQPYVNLWLTFTLSKCALILGQCNIVLEQLLAKLNLVFLKKCLGKFKLLQDKRDVRCDLWYEIGIFVAVEGLHVPLKFV